MSIFAVVVALLWSPCLAEQLKAEPHPSIVQIVDQADAKEHSNLRHRQLCSPSVSVTKDRYAVDEEVQVIINVCQSWAYEWFGIYQAGVSPDIAPAFNWQFTCGGQYCASPQNVGGFLFGMNDMTTSVGLSTWPLSSGSYIVYYFSAFGAFSSSTFRIGSDAPAVVQVPVTPNIPDDREATYLGNLDFSSDPLGECQGDCDRNSDCLPGYFCWQRNEGEQMPYCKDPRGAIDYCIPESEAPAKKIRMHWDNYFWQETNQEFFWCMTCTECDELTTGDGWEGGCKAPAGDKCKEGNLIWIHECRDVRKRFDIVPNTGSGDQIRVHDTNLCFSNRENRFLELRPCDNSIQNQLWAPMNNRQKFEIRPYNQRSLTPKEALCISQLHHPKATEVLSLRECWLNILYETNYWMEWY